MKFAWLAFVLFWAALIFGTSCTVVSTDQLFYLVGMILPPEQVRQFELFWGIAWFTVVKGWHATEFAILTAALIAALNLWKPHARRRNIVVAAVIAVLFAASDEFHQTYVPTRGGTVTDVLIDCLGIGLVTFCAIARERKTRGLACPSTS